MDMHIVLSVLAELQRYRQRDHWTRQQLESYQADALRSLRDYTYAHSPFYRQFHQGLTDAPLQELPVLTKATMMEHFDELVTDRAIRLEEAKAHMRNLTGDERFLGRYRVNATAHSWWMPEIRLAASEPMETIVERLNAWQPEVLIAYASMMRILADKQLAGRLQIRPAAVLTSSEVLTEETRRRIVQAWGERLFNQYAATECGSLAAECDHHRGMHLMEDLVIFEVVDRNNLPVPPGVYGDKLLITVLFNNTQPLIRYELSDSVRLATDPCPSGHPFALIDDIQGRMEDILSFPGTAGGVVQVHPLVFSRIMDTLPVSGWQVVQEADRLRVMLSGVHGKFGDEILADTLREALREQGVIIPRVEVQRVSAIPKTAAGKAPLIKSNLSPSLPRADMLHSGESVKENV